MQNAPQEERNHKFSDDAALHEQTCPGGSTAPPADGPDKAIRIPLRFRPIQLWICLLFFVEGILGWFVVGWSALILCVLGTIYLATIARRKPTQAGAEQAGEDDH